MEAATATTASVVDLIQAVKGIAPVIREHAEANDRERSLAPVVVDAMRAAGLFRMWTPRAFGGLEVDPVGAMRVLEHVARLDSAAGWNLQLSTGIVPFLAWFPDEGVDDVLSAGPDLIVGGTLFPPGSAVPVEGGYLVTGQWPFVSGCQHASWFLGPVIVKDADATKKRTASSSMQRIVAFRAKEATVIDTWHTLGMRGTGSHDVTVKDVFVPTRRTAVLAPLVQPAKGFEGPLYRLTIWTAVAALAAPALGIARAAIDALLDLASRKTPNYTKTTLRERPVVQSQVGQAEALLAAARASLHSSLREAWEEALEQRPVEQKHKIGIQLASSFAVQAAAQVVDLVHAAAGSSAIRLHQPFEKHFRDVHVLTQHAFMSSSRYESVGKLLVGLETDWPFFAL